MSNRTSDDRVTRAVCSLFLTVVMYGLMTVAAIKIFEAEHEQTTRTNQNE